ncbi:MAG: DUF3500 domain-containing protein [Armatimonadota bacterium]
MPTMPTVPTHRFWISLTLAAGPAALLGFFAAAQIAGAVAQPPLSKAKPADVRDGATLAVAARTFLSALTPPLRQKAVFPFAADERVAWHYVPMARRGAALGEMDEAQRAAAMNLLRAAVSAPGFRKIETIRALENVLRGIENGSPNRDPEKYYLTVFGEPSAQGVWALRYEGHHLSFHWMVKNGKVVASTPQFLGANPARVGSRTSAAGPREGTTALSGEENLGRMLVTSLTTAQRTKAVVSDVAPGEILTTALRRAVLPAGTAAGLRYAEMDARQKGMLESVIREHASVQTASVSARRLEAIRKAGMDDVRFAWMGSLEKGQGHYYRIQGKTFLIEYDNTQNKANHIHTVWRDFRGDFGEDVPGEDTLARHYERFSPGTAAGLDHGHDHGASGMHSHPHP